MNDHQSTIITLFSSDATVQYVKDIFSVLSLPRGSQFQFRYQNNYIDPRISHLFSNNNRNQNIKAIVAFRSSSFTTPDKRFYIPIRWVRIQSIIQISNGYTVNFETDSYPSYLSDFRSVSTSFEKLNESAQHFFQQPGANAYAVWGEALSVVRLEDEVDRDSENWFEIVRRLTLIPEYKDYHFFKCSPLYTEKFDSDYGNYEKRYCEKKGYFTEFIEGRCVNIDIEYYSENYDRSKKRQIDVLIDESILSKAKGLRTILQSRYGSIKLGLQSKRVRNNTITEIVINTNSSVADELQTEIIFPVVIKKNELYKFIKAVITSVGALFVALPGIIGTNLNLSLNILFAGLGVVVLGINNYWESKE